MLLNLYRYFFQDSGGGWGWGYFKLTFVALYPDYKALKQTKRLENISLESKEHNIESETTVFYPLYSD